MFLYYLYEMNEGLIILKLKAFVKLFSSFRNKKKKDFIADILNNLNVKIVLFSCYILSALTNQWKNSYLIKVSFLICWQIQYTFV